MSEARGRSPASAPSPRSAPASRGCGAASSATGPRCGAIDRFDASAFPSRIAAQIDDFDPAGHLDARRARRLDRFSALSVDRRPAGGRARRPAVDNGVASRTGVWSAPPRRRRPTARSSTPATSRRGTRGVSPTLALAVFGGAGASNVALDLGLTGPSVGNANSCASGAMAIGQAFHAIRDGTVDVALAGGAEAPLAPLTFGAFALIRVLSSRNDDPGERLAAVRPRPRRLRDGRGGGDPRPRGARGGPRPRGDAPSPRCSASARATTRTT